MNRNDKRIGIFSSGGLTSWSVCRFLKECNFDIIAFLADVGQKDEENIDDFLKDCKKAEIPVVKIDLKKEIAEMGVLMVKYLAKYEGGYWNSTGALRAVLVKNISNLMREYKCTMFSHGCVGGGNDQKRFDNYGNIFLKDIEVQAPWSNQEFLSKFRNRDDMVNYLLSFGNYSTLDKKRNSSTDGSLIGTSHEGTNIENLNFDYSSVVKPVMSVMPYKAEDKDEKIELTFKSGVITQINGNKVTPLEALCICNDIAGNNGVSLFSVVENRIKDTKCRGIYESPGMNLLGYAMLKIYESTIGKREFELLTNMSKIIGKQIYQGRFFENSTTAACKAIDQLAENANGTVRLSIYKGNIHCCSISDYYISNSNVQQKRFAHGGHIWDKK
ncbi:argininosuccinate synthase domain-containing protein [Clostridium beijerinckii]|uniref:argininosuccinate synthase n=1 Tax=Clostridium beijerinckii TaxID=1520 RepID=A0AAX0B2N8_CLOBE|nr:argininosuccinate synthase domain-containing protein [Clostridium beijerinckii]NRT88953.1 argininosuccinate synthase [Clostridium beijerinckii]NYC74408.1 argininosuccinate synthase [Clostridium beijerinckii]